MNMLFVSDTAKWHALYMESEVTLDATKIVASDRIAPSLVPIGPSDQREHINLCMLHLADVFLTHTRVMNGTLKIAVKQIMR